MAAQIMAAHDSDGLRSANIQDPLMTILNGKFKNVGTHYFRMWHRFHYSLIWIAGTLNYVP